MGLLDWHRKVRAKALDRRAAISDRKSTGRLRRTTKHVHRAAAFREDADRLLRIREGS